ncbi:hypothetical protein HanPI659440_Chr03g0134261 [Helianthus annuus]|nr:hypothetical protein HanPI659440_Chr03g0134261 [Helianthus annuus]
MILDINMNPQYCILTLPQLPLSCTCIKMAMHVTYMIEFDTSKGGSIKGSGGARLPDYLGYPSTFLAKCRIPLNAQ